MSFIFCLEYYAKCRIKSSFVSTTLKDLGRYISHFNFISTSVDQMGLLDHIKVYFLHEFILKFTLY